MYFWKKHITGSLGLAAAILIFAIPGGLCARPDVLMMTTLETRFIQANRDYSQGRYPEAMQAYSDLLKQAGPSAGLYYDLGCAQLKAGSLGVAVVSFLRAARLDPRDPDIQANLNFVQALVRPENEQTESEGFINGTLFRWLFLLSDREVSFIQVALLLFVTLGATLLAAGYTGWLKKYVLVATIAGTLLLLMNSLLLGTHYYRDHYAVQAVVLEPNSDARSGPGEDNTRVLVLPEGTVVRLQEERSGWALVSLPSGRSGWVMSSRLEKI